MAQTKEGAVKIAAKKAGTSVEDYQARVAQGEKWCFRCNAWHPVAEFTRDASRSDGREASCRASRNRAHQDAYEPLPRPAPGRRYVEARDGDVGQARRRVNHLVDMKLIPRPNDLPCTDCGHIWSAGERRHEYDHFRGYAAEHHEDVEPVCTTCHAKREAERVKNEEKACV